MLARFLLWDSYSHTVMLLHALPNLAEIAITVFNWNILKVIKSDLNENMSKMLKEWTFRRLLKIQIIQMINANGIY